ncbi:metal ABC transporter ATP-binding protein [candidate division KSB1 bacterium]
MNNEREILIEYKNVSLGYGKTVVHSNLNFNIKAGDYWGLVGPNGAGKTTLVKSILGLVKPFPGGEIVCHKSHGKKIRFGYIPQRESLDVLYPLTVDDVVMMGRYGLLRPGVKPKDEDREYVRKSLEEMGITNLRDRLFRSLSFGQQQRVLIARAFTSEPEVLICDEPANEMDIKSQEAIIELLCHFHKEHHMTVILISHHLAHIVDHVEKIALINRQFWRAGNKDDVITEEALSDLYQIPVSIKEIDGKIVVLTKSSCYD